MNSKVEFTPPKEFTLPEGVEPGADFDLVCSFRVKKGGKICLVQLGETDMPGYEDDDESGPPKYGEAKEMMTAGMPPEGQ